MQKPEYLLENETHKIPRVSWLVGFMAYQPLYII